MNLTKTSKYKKHYETLYFDPMWMLTSDQPTFRQSKHIYLGETRIATRMKIEGDETHGYETVNTYYYHSDHLGSANIITDYEGGIYEHIEYTPYGESWIEKSSDLFDMLPYKFTAKELDDETALYYYGARYLDPRTSRWISADPGLESYVPLAPVDDEAKKHNKALPGEGGVFNPINLNLYHYAGNNPVKYSDPDGKETNMAEYLIRAIMIERDPEVAAIYEELDKSSARGTTIGVGFWASIVSGSFGGWLTSLFAAGTSTKIAGGSAEDVIDNVAVAAAAGWIPTGNGVGSIMKEGVKSAGASAGAQYATSGEVNWLLSASYGVLGFFSKLTSIGGLANADPALEALGSKALPVAVSWFLEYEHKEE